MKRTSIKALFLTILLFMPKMVLAADYAYRGKELKVVYIIGVVLLAIRIAVPILLMVIASIDLVKALVQNDENDIKKVLKGIVPKVIISIAILLLPTLLLLILKLTNSTGLFSEYSKCLLRPSSCSVQMFEEPPEIEETSSRDLIVIDQPENINYNGVDYSKFKWTYYKSNSGPLTNYEKNVNPYAIWAPEDINELNGASLPLILWFHGSGETTDKASKTAFMNSGMISVVDNWNNSGLKYIPAIIMAPQSNSNWWAGHKDNTRTILALIKYAKEHYNIDNNNIVFMGHSMGGFGAVELTWELKDKVKVSKIVTMSSQQGSYKEKEGGKQFYSNIPIKGYGEIERQQNFFNWVGQPNNFIYYKGEKHANVPKRAMLEDKNSNGVSDLVEWLFGVDNSIYTSITYEVIKPNSNEIIYKQEETNTLKVYITKEKTYYLTRIWMTNPYNQTRKEDSPNYGERLYRPLALLENSINNNNLESKLLLGFNASGFYSKENNFDAGSVHHYSGYNNTSVGTLVITNGKVIRNQYEKGDIITWFIYGIDKNNKLKVFEDKKISETNSNEKKLWSEQVISSGIRNTYTFAAPVILNGERTNYNSNNSRMPGSNDGKKGLQLLCQINDNNFALFTSASETRNKAIDVFMNLGCKTAVNLDGGGSVALLFKSANSNKIEVIVGNNRSLPEVGYFSE